MCPPGGCLCPENQPSRILDRKQLFFTSWAIPKLLDPCLEGSLSSDFYVYMYMYIWFVCNFVGMHIYIYVYGSRAKYGGLSQGPCIHSQVRMSQFGVKGDDLQNVCYLREDAQLSWFASRCHAYYIYIYILYIYIYTSTCAYTYMDD